MLKILKRLTAIVLSFMMLLTGGRGYAMYQSQNQNNGNSNGNNGGGSHLIVSDGTVVVRGGHARGFADKVQFNALSGVGEKLLNNLNTIIFNDAEIDHLHSLFKTEGLHQIFDVNKIDFKKEIVAISMQDFFLYPPKNMQDLINKCKLKKELTNFYALSDLSQIDIEEGMRTDAQGRITGNDKKGRNCCQVIKCCALKNSPIIATVIVAPIALIIALAAFLEDGKLTPMEKGGIAILVVLTAISAVVGAFAAKTCCGGCCGCCAPDGTAFLDRKYSKPESKDVSYFKEFLGDISTNITNVTNVTYVFNKSSEWGSRDTILFFPLKENKKYVMGIVKNIASLGDRNLPTNFPNPSFQTIFEKNKDYFFNALNNHLNDHREERNE